MSIHPLTRHYPAISKMPQVKEVKQTFEGPQKPQETLTLSVASSGEAHLLNPLISDEIRGFPVRFQAEARDFIHPTIPSTAKDIVKTYGDTIKSLPGVTDVFVENVMAGGGLATGFTPTVTIATDDANSAKLVDDIISDQINYVAVAVRAGASQLKI